MKKLVIDLSKPIGEQETLVDVSPEEEAELLRLSEEDDLKRQLSEQ